MTTDTEQELADAVHDHPATVTPLLDRAGVTDTAGFQSAPFPIVVEDNIEGDFDFVAAGEQVARDTYETIVLSLQDLRNQRTDLNAEIARLDEAERIWRPIVDRLDKGIVPRPRKQQEELTPLDTGI